MPTQYRSTRSLRARTLTLLLSTTLTLGLQTTSLAQERTASSKPPTTKKCPELTVRLQKACDGYRKRARDCERQQDAQSGAIAELRKQHKDQRLEWMKIVEIERKRADQAEAKIERRWHWTTIAGLAVLVTSVGLGGVALGEGAGPWTVLGASAGAAGGVVLLVF